MPTYEIDIPGKGTYEVDSPNELTDAQVYAAVQPQLNQKPKSRTWGEAATDIGGSLISGVGQLAQIPGQIGQLAGFTEPEEKPTGLQGIGKQVEEYGQELKSPVLKGKEAARARKVAAAGEEGGLKGVASQFGTAIKETITDPALITSFFAEQIPNLFGSMGGGLLVKGGTKLLMSDAIKASLGAEKVGSILGKAGTSGAVGTGAVMQGADIGSDTYEAVYKRLEKEQPNMPAEERNRIALAQGREAALDAFGISIATSMLPGGSSIERALAGKGQAVLNPALKLNDKMKIASSPSAMGVARGFLGEAGSESLEEGGGQLVSNLAQQKIFPDVNALQNVGQAAGMGALGGGLFGGIAGGVNARNEAQQQNAMQNFEQQRQLALQAEEAQRIAAEQAKAQQPLLLGAENVFMPTPLPDGSVAMTREDLAKYQQDELLKKYASQPADIPNNLALGNETPFQPIGLPDGSVANTREEYEAYKNRFTQKTSPDATVAPTFTPKVFPDGTVATTPEQVEQYDREQLLKKYAPQPADVTEKPPTPPEVLALGAETPFQPVALPDNSVATTREEYEAFKRNNPDFEANKPFTPETLPDGSVANTPEELAYYEENKFKPTVSEAGTIALTPEAAELQAKGAIPVTNELLNDLGVSKGLTNLRNKVLGKNLADPAQLTEVRSALESYTKLPKTKPETLAGIKRFLADPAFQLPVQEEVTQTVEQANVPAGVEALPAANVPAPTVSAIPTVAPAATKTKGKQSPKIPKAIVDELLGNSTPGLVVAAQKGSVTYALNEIAQGKGFSPLEQLIAKRLLSNKRYSLPKIEIVPNGSLGKASGQYNSFTDTIQITEDSVNSHVILHEAVHGFVHALIGEFEQGKISNFALMDLKNLYDYLLENHPELSEQYGMKSLSEFASEAMSNPDFQNALQKIPYKKRNVFQAFAQAVMKLLGLGGDTNTALAEAIINVERAMNVGRGYQENVSGTAKAAPIANVVNKAELDALNIAGGGRPTGKVDANSIGSAINKNAETSEADAVRILTNSLDAFETGALSFDAALNNAVRRELNKDKKDWNVIKNLMTKISTSQALHSDAMAMQFLEHGSLVYNKDTYKFFAEDSADSWKNMMSLMSSVAKENGLTDVELRNYANTAFIAARMEGLTKEKPEFYSHLSKEQIAAGKELFNKVKGLDKIQDMWNGIRKNAMDIAVEHGLYSRSQADYLLKQHDFVPFYREDQLESSGGPNKYANGFIGYAKNFKIKGSDKPVADVFGNMALWTTYTVSRAVRNRAALNMYETVREVMPDQVKTVQKDEITGKKDNIVNLWVNGERKRIRFADPLFVHAFEGMETIAIPLLKKFASSTNFLRQTIVLNPLFSLSQLSQDSFAAMMTSGLKNPLMIPFEVIRQFVGILFGANATGKYLSRAGVVGINDYMSAMSNNNLEIATGLKQKSMFQTLLSPFEKFSMASDNAVRQALYNRTLLETGGKRQADGTVKGGDEAAAMERAFEIINFKRSGANSLVNVGKQLVPFFGAYLQAMNVTAKVLSGRSITPTERAAAYKTLMWNTMMVTTLAFLYSAMVSGDDDYEKMDPQIRDKHLVIPGTGFMLPLRNDFSMFPKLAAEYSYLLMTDNGFTDGKKVRRAMSSALANAVLSPTVVPQFIKPAVEVGINHNFFTGRDLVNKGISGLEKEYQFTESTSEFAKMLGKLGILAPVEIDHLIKGYAGTVGGLGLMFTSAIMSEGSKPEKSTQDELRQIPGMSTFVASEYGNAMKNDFYELRGDVNKVVQTMNELKTKSPEEAKAYMQEKTQLLKLQQPINNINNQLNKMRKYEDHIRSLPESKMSAEEKKARLDKVKESEERMLKNVYRLREMAGYAKGGAV